MGILTYLVKPEDTLKGIAQQFAVSEEMLIAFNHLEYPYLAPLEYEREGYSRGVLTVVNTSSVNIILPKSTRVIATFQNQTFTFLTREPCTVPGERSITVPVQAESYGSAYNLPPQTTWVFPDFPELTATNREALTGGFYKRVVKPGELLYIPSPDPVSIKEPWSFTLLYGTDILGVSSDSTQPQDIVFTEHGDVALVSGVANLAQATSRRLTTPYRSYLLHPEYGSNVPLLVGEAITASLPQRLSYEVYTTLKQDGRVKDVRSIEVQIQQDAVLVSCTVQTVTDLTVPLTLVVK